MPNLKERVPRASLPGISPRRAALPAPGASTPVAVPGEADGERITPETRTKVWKKRFGFRSTGTCVCCHRTTIYRNDFVCGHRRTYAGGGSDVGNLEPICAGCSRSMGTQDLVSWCRKKQEELRLVKPMPKTTATKKPVRKTTAKKPAAKAAVAKKTVRKAVAKKAVARKPVRKTAAKKSAAKKKR